MARPDQLEGFLPNPNEVVPPPTAQDAFKDCYRYAIRKSSRTRVSEAANRIYSSDILLMMQGSEPTGRLTKLEQRLVQTLEYCVGQGLVTTSAGAIAAMEIARVYAFHGILNVSYRKRTPAPQ